MKNIINTYIVKLAVFCSLILLSGCNKTQPQPQQQMLAKVDTALQPNTKPQKNEKYSCQDLLKELILSSNLKALKKFKEVNVRSESISADKITIEVYAKETSDRTGELRTVENTVAWLEFIPESKKLYDITADPESPVTLNYDKSIFTRHSLSELCSLKTAKSVQRKADISCKEISGEMASGQECILSSTTLLAAYKDLIDQSAVKDSKYLPKKLPQKNTSIEVNQNGLMNIDFQIAAGKVSIEMGYAGGITDVILQQQGNNVKRTVMYNAN